MEHTRLQPGDMAPVNATYQVIDRFGEMLNVEVWCEEGERLPILGVAGFNPVSYRVTEATITAKAAN